jgi:hypothetical protein
MHLRAHLYYCSQRPAHLTLARVANSFAGDLVLFCFEQDQ